MTLKYWLRSGMYPFPMYSMRNQLSLYNKNLSVPNGFWNNNKQIPQHLDPSTNLMPDSHNNTNSDISITNKDTCLSDNEKQNSKLHNPDQANNQVTDNYISTDAILNAQKLFKCETCGKLFAQKVNLQNHERTHTGQKPFVCLVCLKAFSQRTNLKNHERIHSGERPYVCIVCSKSFSQRTNLRNHERVHSGERPYKCMMCPKAFSQLTNLRNHERTHTGVKPYTCTVCLKSFAQQAELTCHERVHTGIKPYTCSYCLKAFSQLTNLRNHERIHTKEKPFKCPVCTKAFSQRTDLRNHLRVHTKEKPFCCSVCPKAFAQRTDLKNHIRTHSGEKPYVCLVCGKAFSQVTNLRNHERTHSGEKPFSCSLCGKAFSQRSTLKNHERTHNIGIDIDKYQGKNNKCMELNCHDCGVCQGVGNFDHSADSSHERLCSSKNEIHIGLNSNSKASENLPGGASGKNSLTCDICQKQFSLRVQLDNHVCIESADEASSLLQHQTFLKECQSSTPKSQSSSLISKWMINCVQQQKQDQSKETPPISGNNSPPSSSSPSVVSNSASLVVQNTHLAPGPENPWFFLGGDLGSVTGGPGDLRLQSAILSSGYLHTGWSNHYGWPRGFPVTPRWSAISKDLTSSVMGPDSKPFKQKDSKNSQKIISKNMTSKQKLNSVCDNPSTS